MNWWRESSPVLLGEQRVHVLHGAASLRSPPQCFKLLHMSWKLQRRKADDRCSSLCVAATEGRISVEGLNSRSF